MPTSLRRLFTLSLLTFSVSVSLLCVAVPARATTAYAILSDDDFGTIDLSTGVFTQLGNSGLDLTGLGEVGGSLYSASRYGTLYSIDTTNGNLSPIGIPNSSPYADAFASTVSGLFFLSRIIVNNNFVYEADSIDPSTGVAKDLGSTGLSPGFYLGSLSTNSGTLYFASGTNGSTATNLYTINTTTGAATLIGPTGVPKIGPLMWDGTSVLYGAQYTACCFVDLLNTGTGTATTGPALTDSFVYGVAPLLGSPPTQYLLTITASPSAGGTVTPANGSSFASGTVVPITATANSGYQFTGWTGPVASASSASTSVTMSAFESVTANSTAVATQYQLSTAASPASGGSVTANPTSPNGLYSAARGPSPPPPVPVTNSRAGLVRSSAPAAPRLR